MFLDFFGGFFCLVRLDALVGEKKAFSEGSGISHFHTCGKISKHELCVLRKCYENKIILCISMSFGEKQFGTNQME